MKKLKKFVVLCLAVTMLLTACGKKGEDVTKELSITQMQTICELATLKCYYHNVAKLTKEKEVLWWDTSAELWIEYSGIVKLGVNIANLDSVQSDESLLKQAQQRAQELLEQYVKNVGDAMGKTYEVRFEVAENAGTDMVSTEEVQE